jgi:hypothetical protein
MRGRLGVDEEGNKNMTEIHAKSGKKSTYVSEGNPELEKVVKALRSYVKKVLPSTRITINAWGIPTFEADAPFCFYMVGKRHVTFGFHFGAGLSDPGGLLEGTGRNLRHVKLRTVEDLKRPGFRELILDARANQGRGLMRGMSGKKKGAKKK